METTKKDTTESSKQGGGRLDSDPGATAGQQTGGFEIIDQTKQAFSDAYDKMSRTLDDAYDKTSEAVSATYDQAKNYGRENPGKLTLIAFGAGIGIGLLLASGFTSRNRTSRALPPVVKALSNVILELLR